jgi:hypothetical protein
VSRAGEIHATIIKLVTLHRVFIWISSSHDILASLRKTVHFDVVIATCCG